MNIEQARKNLETATAIRKEAEQKLEDHYNLVNGANEAEKAAESIFLDILANEPAEDKVIDMSHFIGSNLIMEFSFAVARSRSALKTSCSTDVTSFSACSIFIVLFPYLKRDLRIEIRFNYLSLYGLLHGLWLTAF